VEPFRRADPYPAAAVRNPLSLIGIVVATTTALLFLALIALELLGYVTNPYIRLLAFVAIPTVFVVGLLLILVGTAPPSSGAGIGALARLRFAGSEPAYGIHGRRAADCRKPADRVDGGRWRRALHGIIGILRTGVSHHHGARIPLLDH